MSKVQRSLIVLAVACAGVLTQASIAAAGPDRYRLRVTPASPTLRQSVTLTLSGPALEPGTRYEASFGTSGGGGLECTSGGGWSAMRRARDGSFTITFRPRHATAGPATTTWCPGHARAGVRRSGPGGLHSGWLSRRPLTVRLGPGDSQPQVSSTPAKVTLLAGSTLTATVPDRPVQPSGPAHADRSTPLTGTLRGRILGRFAPDADINTADVSGAITPVSFAPDPLCPGAAPPATFDSAAPSTLSLAVSGSVSWALILKGGPSQLFGCGPAGPPSGTTILPLRGTLGTKGVAEVALTGSAGDITLADGAKGVLTANLVVNVDFSGRR